MDNASQNTIEFLNLLQEAKSQLSDVKKFYAESFKSTKKFFTLTDGTYTIWADGNAEEYVGNISLGLHGLGQDDRDYEIVVGIQWNSSNWLVDVEAWVQCEETDGQNQIGEEYRYQSNTLNQCKRDVFLAIGNLKSYKNLMPTLE